MNNSLTYNPHIDGLRAVAVLSVLLFHLDISGFNGGFVGVDIFFVISGFLITRLIKKELDETGSFSFREFYLRRIRRLLPAYIVMLIGTSVVAALSFSPAQLERFGAALSSAVFSVSNFFFWYEADYFDVSSNTKPLLHTWSLGIEEQFYLIWPISLVFIYRSRFRRSIPYLLVVCILVSLFLNYIHGDGEIHWVSNLLPKIATLISNGKSTIFFLLPFRIFEFSIGALLVWVIQYRPSSQSLHELLFWSGLSLIAYSLVFFNDTVLFPSFAALIPCIGTFMVIYSGDRTRAAAILNNRLAIGIGLISYSLYLVHWPIIVFWDYLNPATALRPLDKILIITCSFIAAYSSYTLVEKPFRVRQFSIGVKKWKVAIPVLLMLFGLGLHMKMTGGWPRSVPYTVNFDNVGSASNFHRKYYGGAGYPSYGAVNTTAPPDIILIGDSHGRHYAEGIYKELAEPNGLSLYIAAGTSCFHLPNFTRTTKGSNWNIQCPKALSKLMEFVELAQKPPLVIVSHSWLFQMAVADTLDQEGRPGGKNIEVGDIVTGIQELKELIRPSTLVIIGEVPRTNGINLYDIFTRPTLLLSPDFNLDSYLTASIEKPLWNFNQALSLSAKESNDFVFLNPFDVFCDKGSCINVDQEQRLIYSDAAHLSTYGSRLIVSRFKPVLEPLLHNTGFSSAMR